MTRERSPRDDLWDVLAEFFPPVTKSERSMIGKVLVELLEVGATPDEARTVCAYVQRKFDPVSVMAVPKWYSVALRESTPTSTIEEVMREWTSGSGTPS